MSRPSDALSRRVLLLGAAGAAGALAQGSAAEAFPPPLTPAAPLRLWFVSGSRPVLAQSLPSGERALARGVRLTLASQRSELLVGTTLDALRILFPIPGGAAPYFAWTSRAGRDLTLPIPVFSDGTLRLQAEGPQGLTDIALTVGSQPGVARLRTGTYILAHGSRTPGPARLVLTVSA